MTGFPFDRFLRAGATFDEAGEIGAFYGKNTTRFDGLADGELRRVISEHRSKPAVLEHSAEAMPDEGLDAARDGEGEDSQRPEDDKPATTEGKRARNQSRSSHPSK